MVSSWSFEGHTWEVEEVVAAGDLGERLEAGLDWLELGLVLPLLGLDCGSGFEELQL